MTTYVNFTPDLVSAFQFQATLDGAQYNIITTWNIFGQRYYANIYALDGTLQVAIPFIESQNPLPIERIEYLPVPGAGTTGSATGSTAGSASGTMSGGSITVTDDFTIFGSVGAGALNSVMVQAQNPHGYEIGSLVDLIIAGVNPPGYNGQFRCQIVDEFSFIYDLPTNLGLVSAPGWYSKDISLVEGYFTSTLVWRVLQNRFEINP